MDGWMELRQFLDNPAGVAKVRYVAEGTLATLEAAYNLHLEEKNQRHSACLLLGRNQPQKYLYS